MSWRADKEFDTCSAGSYLHTYPPTLQCDNGRIATTTCHHVLQRITLL
jgi:hypothetical protein